MVKLDEIIKDYEERIKIEESIIKEINYKIHLFEECIKYYKLQKKLINGYFLDKETILNDLYKEGYIYE